MALPQIVSECHAAGLKGCPPKGMMHNGIGHALDAISFQTQPPSQINILMIHKEPLVKPAHLFECGSF